MEKFAGLTRVKISAVAGEYPRSKLKKYLGPLPLDFYTWPAHKRESNYILLKYINRFSVDQMAEFFREIPAEIDRAYEMRDFVATRTLQILFNFLEPAMIAKNFYDAGDDPDVGGGWKPRQD